MKAKKEWGGKRPKAGRPTTYKVAMDRYTIRLTPEQAATATSIGKGDLSAGIRAIIDAAKK